MILLLLLCLGNFFLSNAFVKFEHLKKGDHHVFAIGDLHIPGHATFNNQAHLEPIISCIKQIILPAKIKPICLHEYDDRYLNSNSSYSTVQVSTKAEALMPYPVALKQQLVGAKDQLD